MYRAKKKKGELLQINLPTTLLRLTDHAVRCAFMVMFFSLVIRRSSL